MRQIKMFVATVLIVTAFTGVPTASAETTALCSVDESPCKEGNLVTHVHQTSVGKGKLLTSFLTVECDVLFLGDTKNVKKETESLATSLRIEGTFTYTNCGSCTATEENGPSEIKVLKEGHELASVTGEGLVYVVCGESLNCSYNGLGLKAIAKGPLLATQANGEVSLQKQSTNKEAGGFLCPETSKLDLTMTAGDQTLTVGCEKVIDKAKPIYISS